MMTNMLPKIGLAGMALVLTLSAAEGADVTVRGVHLCCGGCDAAVEEALGEVEGVSNVTIDRNAKIVRFVVGDDRTAQAGINALATAGFHGKAAHGEKPLAFPASGATQGRRADTIVLTGLHLCCNACVTGVQEALQEIDGVSTIDIDRSDRTAKLVGKDMAITAAVAALNQNGFHASVK